MCHQEKNWEFTLGTKISKSIKRGKRDLIRKCTVFQQYHHLPHPVTKNRTLPYKLFRDNLWCDLLTLLLFFKLFKYHEYKIIMMKENCEPGYTARQAQWQKCVSLTDSSIQHYTDLSFSGAACCGNHGTSDVRTSNGIWVVLFATCMQLEAWQLPHKQVCWDDCSLT